MRIESRTRQKRRTAARVGSGVAVLVAVSTVGFLFSFAFGADQHPAGIPAKGFKSPLSYFPPPHELQMQSFLEAKQAETGPDGLVILYDAKLQTFREDGSREMIMKAPQCNYDYNKHVVNSTGAMQVETWDDTHTRALQVRGTNGFFWQQTNSLLVVSNKQATTISGPLTNSFTP